MTHDESLTKSLVDHIANITVPKMTKLFFHIQDIFLATHVTNLTEINSLRAVSMDFYSYYNVAQVKKIAIKFGEYHKECIYARQYRIFQIT